MAGQLLPLILLGSGAAYVYSKQKKKARRRSGADCPPENTVTLGEMATLSAQTEEKFKNNPDPFAEANYAIEHLISKHCNRNSKNSRIKVQVDDKEALDISVPDFYMLILSNRVGDRVDKGLITEDQANAHQAKALDWYKSTTGKTFDPTTLGLEKFAQALALAMAKAIKEGIKKGEGKVLPSPSPTPGECPDHIVINFTEEDRKGFSMVTKMMVDWGEKNPFAIADRLFKGMMPMQCSRSNFRTTVDVQHDGELFKSYNASSLYAAITLGVMEDMIDQGAMTEQAAHQVFNDIKASYKQLTGEELPPNLN